MEQLGPSLRSVQQDVAHLERRALLNVGEQALSRLQAMHERHWLHLDVKPANLLLPLASGPPHGDEGSEEGLSKDGSEEGCPTLHLIDFGLSRRWWDPRIRAPVLFTPRRGAIGTVRFASIANQQAEALGRRDDLESLVYTLLFLHHGELPWGSVQAPTKRERFRLMLEVKMRLRVDELCVGLPPLATFLHTVRRLRPDEPPNYDLLRAILRTL